MSNILIVGANRGIGYYMAIRLLEKGNKRDGFGHSRRPHKWIKKEVSEFSSHYQIGCNRWGFIIRGHKKSIKEFGNVDIAIHNACLCTFANEQDTGYEVYKKVMDVNYFGALRLSKLILPFMREKKEGRIIFTSSGVGVTDFGNISPYASSKGAIESLAKCLEIENQDYGITFHIMHPPLTNTASSSELSRTQRIYGPMLKK